MKYLKTKKDSLEEAISKAMNEKPDSSSELKEARYEIEFSPGEFGQDDADDFADMIQNDLKNDYKIRAKVLNTGRKAMGLTFDTNVPKAKMLKVLEDEMGYVVEGYDVNAKELEEAGGKYLKYSDLLLQKGRMMAKNKSTAMIDREIEKEKKRLGIKDEFDAQLQGMAEAVTEGDKEDYTKFFNAALKKFGVKSPADFKDDAKKKEFFNYVDKNYKGDHEEGNMKEYVQADGTKRKVKEGDKRLKANKLSEKDLDNNVEESLETIQQANDSKRQSMRSILADIWKMNEGKSPFEKDEGFASDAQRRAAFASGYKAKGKKGKKEEIEKSDKTMTGKKPTKVEIEPQVK